MDETTWDLGRMLQVDIDGMTADFDLSHFQEVEKWSASLEGQLRAKALSASLNEHSSEVIIEECARSIAEAANWFFLLTELLVTAEISPAVMAVAQRVVQAHNPAHPLARKGGQPAFAVEICDAIRDSSGIHFRMPGVPSTFSEALAVDPQDALSRCDRVRLNPAHEKFVIPLDDITWFDKNMMACPSFIILAQLDR
ncbi:MAG: hypothetical protein K9G33_11060 [Sneathiella sp.]|jgi:hypothetical protein|nr:hypothetical protein [Sneathiella sp.]